MLFKIVQSLHYVARVMERAANAEFRAWKNLAFASALPPDVKPCRLPIISLRIDSFLFDVRAVHRNMSKYRKQLSQKKARKQASAKSASLLPFLLALLIAHNDKGQPRGYVPRRTGPHGYTFHPACFNSSLITLRNASSNDLSCALMCSRNASLMRDW